MIMAHRDLTEKKKEEAGKIILGINAGKVE